MLICTRLKQTGGLCNRWKNGPVKLRVVGSRIIWIDVSINWCVCTYVCSSPVLYRSWSQWDDVTVFVKLRFMHPFCIGAGVDNLWNLDGKVTVFIRLRFVRYNFMYIFVSSYLRMFIVVCKYCLINFIYWLRVIKKILILTSVMTLSWYSRSECDGIHCR